MPDQIPVVRLTITLILAILVGACSDESPVARKGPDPRPAEWDMDRRLFPHYRADSDAYVVALRDASLLRRKSQQNKNVWTEARWENVGPSNIGGRISDIEFDPSRPDTVYAGAATGGVWKSVDRGQSWVPIFDDYGMLNIGDIGISSSDSDVLYVGTGESNGGHNNFAGGGVFKTTDAGASWESIGLIETAAIGRIIVHPDDPDHVYVAAAGSYFLPDENRGIYESRNGGSTWEKVLFISDSTGFIDLVMHPENPAILHAAAWNRVRRPDETKLAGPESGIYRSENGGDTWTRLGESNLLPNPVDESVGRIGLAVTRSRPDDVVALFTNGTDPTGLYRSSDAGKKWTMISDASDFVTGVGGFSWFLGQVRISPDDPQNIFVLDVSLMETKNGGSSWGIKGIGSVLHVDHHSLVFDPRDPSYVLSGNDGGIDISLDRGVSWNSSGPLPITQFYEIAIDRGATVGYYGGTQDNGTIRTLSGRPDSWIRVLGGDGFYTIVHPENPSIIFAETQNGGLYKTTAGPGAFASALNGIPVNEPRNWSTPVVMDPGNPDVLYYGTNRIYKTVNGAGLWTAISEKLTVSAPSSPRGTITAIAIAPSNTNVLYVGTDDAQVWRTTNLGADWTRVTGGLPNRWVTRLAVHPSDPLRVWVTFSGLKWREPQPHVFYSDTGGDTWQDKSAGLPDAPVNALAVNPLDPDIVFIGSDVGAFLTFDNGETWQTLGTGMPSVPVYDFKIDPDRQILLAGTHGRSMYRLPLPMVVVANELDGTEATYDIEAYPNPFSDRISFSVHLDRSTRLHARIYDVRGRLVSVLSDEFVDPGTWVKSWNGRTSAGDDAAPGVYFLHLLRDGGKSAAVSVLRR